MTFHCFFHLCKGCLRQTLHVFAGRQFRHNELLYRSYSCINCGNELLVQVVEAEEKPN